MRVVKWEDAGQEELTPHLAIWGLIMMSLNDNYRHVLPENHLPRLTQWDKADEDGILFKNFFSGREETKDYLTRDEIELCGV